MPPPGTQKRGGGNEAARGNTGTAKAMHRTAQVKGRSEPNPWSIVRGHPNAASCG